MLLKCFLKDILAPVFDGAKYFLCLSLRSYSSNHMKTTKDRDCDPVPVLNQMTYCKVFHLSYGPGCRITSFIFVCKTGHPESVTMFFNQAQNESSTGVFSMNPRAAILLTLPCNCPLSKWRKEPDRGSKASVVIALTCTYIYCSLSMSFPLFSHLAGWFANLSSVGKEQQSTVITSVSVTA